MKLHQTSAVLVLAGLLIMVGAALAVEDESPPPAAPSVVFAMDGPDTLRTNLVLAEALMGEALAVMQEELPPPPAAVVLVPHSSDQAVRLMTTVATHQLMAAGYAVHVDNVPGGTDDPVYELQYRVSNLELSYPDNGRRYLFWQSWFDREMTLAAEMTLVNAGSGEILSSRRLKRSFQDRIPAKYFDAVESPEYTFTKAEPQGGGWSRRLEEIVVLGALVALVAIYFANTE